MNLDIFKRKYTEALQNGNAAIFAGAGLSREYGYVNWKELLRNVAEEIYLDVDKEFDLVDVAQYYFNQYGRNAINNLILNEFITKVSNNSSLDILSRLPIDTFWTTNYDQLIETKLSEYGKKVDIKKSIDNLSTTLLNSDVTVYKMHGDYQNPNSCVLTRDDYDKYMDNNSLFITALLGHLVSKTFLFIGFSFNDPNLKYILSRIKNLLDQNSRKHYCFLEKINPNLSHYKHNPNDYEYDCNKQALRMQDLKRYGIETVLINSYDEIPNILEDIQKSVKNKSVFISGSAYSYGEKWELSGPKLISDLTYSLYSKEYKIITGHGRGVGSYVISTIIEQTQKDKSNSPYKQLDIRAFPYEDNKRDDYLSIIKNYREAIFSDAGIARFLFGNKLVDGNMSLATGMYEEFEIAKSKNCYIIPVGSTGYVAKQIFSEIKDNILEYPYLSSEIDILENSCDVNSILNSVNNILDIIKKNI